VEYKSSLPEYDRFLGSHVYEDIMTDFEDWLGAAMQGLENAETSRDVFRYQGRVGVMRDVINWFENFRAVLEEAAE